MAYEQGTARAPVIMEPSTVYCIYHLPRCTSALTPHCYKSFGANRKSPSLVAPHRKQSRLMNVALLKRQKSTFELNNLPLTWRVQLT